MMVRRRLERRGGRHPGTTAMGVSRASSALSVDFVNTVACPGCHVGDGLESLRSLRAWRKSHPELPSIPMLEASLARLRAFRRDLRAIFVSFVSKGRLQRDCAVRINRFLLEASSRLEVHWRGGRVWLREITDGTAPESRWILSLARSAGEVTALPRRHRLRLCQGPGCVHFLIARTAHQLWCSPSGCGNRVRVARHYRKEQKARGRTISAG